MKRLILSIVILLAAFVAQAQTNIVGCVQLVWTENNPPSVTADPTYHFNVYHSTDINIPLATWTKIATNSTAATNCPIFIPAGTHYFYVTPQNWWQEGPPSNIASTNTPTNLLGVTLRIVSLSPTNSP